MVSELELRERRRGERVLIRIPVQLKGMAEDGREVAESAEALVVSRYGALLRTTSLFKKGSALTVTHGFSQQSEQFRVVWTPEKQTEGRWDIGVEAGAPCEDFWGIRFPPPVPKR